MTRKVRMRRMLSRKVTNDRMSTASTDTDSEEQDLAKEREVKNLKLQKHNKLIYIYVYICAPHRSLLTKALSTLASKSVASN